MNFDFSDEQKQLRDEARKFLADRCSPAAVRAILEGPEPYDRALWKGLGEMGFLGAAIPEEYGGVGLGHLELCVIAEELGRANAPAPMSSSIYLAAEALMLSGTQAQKLAWLPKLASGAAIGTLALGEGVGRVTERLIKAQVAGGKLTASRCRWRTATWPTSLWWQRAARAACRSTWWPSRGRRHPRDAGDH